MGQENVNNDKKQKNIAVPPEDSSLRSEGQKGDAQKDKRGTLRRTKGGRSEGYGAFGSAQGPGMGFGVREVRSSASCGAWDGTDSAIEGGMCATCP